MNSFDEFSNDANNKKKKDESDWSSLYISANPVLFKRFEGKPISFHFKIEDVSLKKKYEYLVVYFGGCAVQDYFALDDKTALMVEDDNKCGIFERPSFKVSYIIDCVLTNTLLDVDNYIHDNYLGRRRGFMCMLFWDSETSEISTCKDSSSSSTDEFACSMKKGKISKNTREQYTRSEKEAILKFLLRSRPKLEGLRGNSIWRTMERKAVCPRRTYQSLKNHFLKTIINELDTFEFLSEIDKKQMRKL